MVENVIQSTTRRQDLPLKISENTIVAWNLAVYALECEIL